MAICTTITERIGPSVHGLDDARSRNKMFSLNRGIIGSCCVLNESMFYQVVLCCLGRR